MEQLAADGIIVIHGCRGIVLVGLVQRNEEYVELLIGQPLDTLTNGGGLAEIQRYKQLIACICAVQIERAVKA